MGSFGRTADAYRATLKEEWEALANYYKEDSFNAIIPMNLSRSTGLHLTVYSGSRKPLEDLVIDNSLINDTTILIKDAYGWTALHEAAVIGNIEAVSLLLSYNPQLLQELNNNGETALLAAAAFGKRKIVTHLASQPNQITADNKLLSIHCHRQPQEKHTDNIETTNPSDIVEPRVTSILHLAVQGEHFGTALELLRLDKSLGQLKDEGCMTCLQHLASMPSAFKSGYRMGIMETILYFCLPIYEDIDDIDDNYEVINVEANNIYGHLTHLARSIRMSIWKLLCLGSPMIKRMWRAKRKHKFAMKLAKELIKEDFSWEENHTIGVEANKQGKEKSQEINTEIPLLLATKNGIVEIVMEILNQYPQAVDHHSHMGQNILHGVFKHHQKEIFDHIKNMTIRVIWLVRGIDNHGCTILHHAAELDTKGTCPGPAFQLQAELKWFKRAQKYIPTYYERYKVGGKTAEQLFKENHADQLKNAQKWIKETSQSCSAVAVLIATVVFAAAYTVPGGSNDQGIPVFLHSPFFLFFTIMDVVSLACSLTSVVMFLSILSSPCEQQDFLYSLPRKLSLGFTLLFFSVATTMLAFAATIVLIIRLNQKQWTTTLIYVAAFFPVTVFALMQFPLYAALLGTLTVSFKKVRKFVSRLFGKKKMTIDMV